MDISLPGYSVHVISQAGNGVGCHFLFQGIFQTQRLSLCLLHWQTDSLCLSHQENPSVSIQFSSVAQSSLTLCDHQTAAHQASLSITNTQSLLKLMSIELVMPSNHLIFCHPLFLLPSVFPSIRIFSNDSVLPIRWQKYWSLSFSISPSNEYSGMISFRIDWFDLLAVQGTLKSLFQHHSSKASIVQCSAFFMVQLSHSIHDYWKKSTALIIQTFVIKVISLLFNMLSSFIIAFLPRREPLVISWLQSPFAVILEPPKIKSATLSTVSPSICHEVMVPDAMILVFRMLSFKPAISLYSFIFIKWLSSYLFSAITMVSSAYLRLLVFLPAILIPACALSSQRFS